MSLYLKIPYSDKDEAKTLGARWDSIKKSWYVFSRKDYHKFNKWIYDDDEQQKIIITDHFYIVEGRRKCFSCGHINTVIAFGIDNFIVINKQSKHYQSYHDDIHIICEPVITDKNFLMYLKNKYNYYFSKSIIVQGGYYANHCKNCGAIQGNFHLFEEVDSPFFLESESNAKELALYKINLKEDIFFNAENSLNFNYNDWLIKKYSQISDCTDFQI